MKTLQIEQNFEFSKCQCVHFFLKLWSLKTLPVLQDTVQLHITEVCSALQLGIWSSFCTYT